MTVQHLHQQIGQLQREANRLARVLELTDRTAEIHGHPDQRDARLRAGVYRLRLSEIYTRMHHLEARLPTPETLSARAYDRMIALGFEIEAAEACRVTTYRNATHAQRHQRAA